MGLDIKRLVKLLLKTAKEEDVKVTTTVIQKTFFLLEKEKGVDLGLEFKPFLFGPYSSKLQDVLIDLREKGEISYEEEDVKDPITGLKIGTVKYYKPGRSVNIKPRPEEAEIVEFFRQWVKKPRHEVMKYIYEKYPEYSRYEYVRKHFLERLFGET